MIRVRLMQYLCFGMNDGFIWRDVELPTIFPGMELTYLFGDRDGPDEEGQAVVERVEYNFKERRLEAWLAYSEDESDPTTFAELDERGFFAGWDTSDFRSPIGA